ncbi:MAG: endo alpha-1,4 polygalactosaminidase [Anaerolineales bacterium]|nr:endo alpha-1,4 polygalactosaminidase [Anaerolineales bacterium]
MRYLYGLLLTISLFFLPACTHSTQLNNTAGLSDADLPEIISWQIQYSGDIDPDLNVEVYNLDLFDTSTDLINNLHQNRVYVQCYFSAGSFEDWRPDAPDYPPNTLGNDLEGWPGEKWLDIRRLDLLGPILEGRLDLAVKKGCDGVDPDNLDGFDNKTSFPLSAEDQLAFNKFLSQAAHSRGLSIGLKNDLNQAADLVSYFDWIINEECFFYQECSLLSSFLEADKPVFVIEYELSPEEFCPQANQLGFYALHKNRDLDSYRVDCRQITLD